MVREYTPEEQERITQKEAEYHELEAQRVKAMNSRNARRYKDLCDILGIVEPELPELIERARTDEIYASRTRRQETPKIRKNRANPEKYKAFLRDAVDCNYDDFSAESEYKRRILMSHFPGRYDRQGMNDYDDMKLGAVFKKIVDSAEEIASRK